MSVDLDDGEYEKQRVPFEEGLSLVSDGNSRWERDGDELVFIVNDNWKQPEE